MPLITGLIGISFTAAMSGLLSAQTLDMGARGLALANAVVGVSRLPFEPVNPAGGPSVESPCASFTFGQAHGLKELQYATLVAVYPLRTVQTGLTIDSFGFSAYRRTTASIVAATDVAPDARVGVRMTIRRHAVSNYGSRWAVGFSAGWTLSISDPVAVGGSWRYIGAPLTDADLLLRQELSVGFEARASPGLHLLGAVVREAGTRVDVRFGAEYNVIDRLLVRFGSGSHPDRIGAGLGVIVEQVSIDLGVSVHPTLGPSIAASVLLE